MPERRYSDEVIAAIFKRAAGGTVQLDRPLSEAEWGYLVTDLRETFSARGKLKSDGDQ